MMSAEEKRISSEQMAAAFQSLSPKEQERLYYMMQGAALVSDSTQKRQGTLHSTSNQK